MSRLFRINGLGENCSHLIDSSASYTYPFLPVGVSGHSLGLNGTISPSFAVFKEHPCSTHWARSDQRHLPLGPIDPVVMAGERRRQKIQQGKKTKVTTADQNGNPFRTERPVPSQEHHSGELTAPQCLYFDVGYPQWRYL